MKSKIYFYIFLNQCKIVNLRYSHKVKDGIIIKKYNYLLSYGFNINNFDLVKFAINKGTGSTESKALDIERVLPIS